MLVGALCAIKAGHVMALPDGLGTSMRRGLVVGLIFSAAVRSGVVVGCRSIPSYSSAVIALHFDSESASLYVIQPPILKHTD